jgi:hypothetical protein
MMDKFLAALALLLIAGFVAIIVGYVPDIDLAIVAIVTVAMVGYDFFRTLILKK